MARGEVDINNFFSFLAAMMLSLSTSKITFDTKHDYTIKGLSAAIKNFTNNRY